MTIPHKLHFVLTEQVYQLAVYEKLLDWVLYQPNYEVFFWTNTFNARRLQIDFRNYLLKRIGRIKFVIPEEYIENEKDIVLGRQPVIEPHRPDPAEYEEYFYADEVPEGIRMSAMHPSSGKWLTMTFGDYTKLSLKKGSKIAEDEEQLWRNKAAAVNFYRLWILHEHGGIALDISAECPRESLPLKIKAPYEVLFKIIFGDGMPKPSGLMIAAIPHSHKVLGLLHTQMAAYRDEYIHSGEELNEQGYATLHEHLFQRQASMYPWHVGHKIFYKSSILREIAYKRLKKKLLKKQAEHREAYFKVSRQRSENKHSGKAIDSWLRDYERIQERLDFQLKRYTPDVRDFEVSGHFQYVDFEGAQKEFEPPEDLDFFAISIAEREYIPYSFERMTNFEITFREDLVIWKNNDKVSDDDFIIV